MKIDQVILHSGQGGMETLVHGLHREFGRLGHHSRVIVLDESRRTAKRLGRLHYLRRKLRERAPDVVFSHSAIPNLYTALAAPKHLDIVSVLHSSADDFSTFRIKLAERAFISKRRRIVAVSGVAAKMYLERFPQAQPKVTIIPNGIEWPAPRDRADGGPGHLRGRAIVIGRIVPGKAIHVLIHAVASPAFPADLEVDIVGPSSDEKYAAYCRGLARDLGVDSRIRWLGPVDQASEMLTNYDLLIHPSLAESQGLVVLEAAARGVPVVSTTAISHALDPAIVRVEAPPDDSESLASACAQAIFNLNTLTSEAMEARAYLRRSYAIRRTAEAYLGLAAEVDPAAVSSQTVSTHE